MRHMMIMTCFCLISTACSGGIDSYEEGMEAQAGIMEEMIHVLEGVDDEASAKRAAGKIENLGNRLAEIAVQVQQLPRPNAREMQALAKEISAERQALQRDAATQMSKIAEYPDLLDAWMRAMENMR